jgi:hypothetical protein
VLPPYDFQSTPSQAVLVEVLSGSRVETTH